VAVGRMIAVLTGDIVGSSGLQRVDTQPVSVLIENAGKWVMNRFPTAIHAQIDVFRGDSWQMVVNEPAIALRIGLYFRALLRCNYGIDSRVSVGFGGVDFLPSDNISTGTGQAFTLSGQGLAQCIKPTRMNLSFPSQERKIIGQGFNTIARLIDLQVGRWTPGQSRAIAGALIDLTQAEIAASWQPAPVSQQAISQHLENAGWAQIKDGLHYMEKNLPLILVS
jgi:hypothetical protein